MGPYWRSYHIFIWGVVGKIFLVESGILGFGIWNTDQGIRNPSSTDKYWNPVSGIRNPRRGIQNPRLCWIISLHGVKDEYLCNIYIYITWIFEPQALSSTNYFSMSILRGSITAGDFVYRCQFSLEKKNRPAKRTERPWLPLGSLLSSIFDPVFCLFLPLRSLVSG